MLLFADKRICMLFVLMVLALWAGEIEFFMQEYVLIGMVRMKMQQYTVC